MASIANIKFSDKDRIKDLTGLKGCTKCGSYKTPDKFYSCSGHYRYGGSRKSKLRSVCKDCYRQASRLAQAKKYKIIQEQRNKKE